MYDTWQVLLILSDLIIKTLELFIMLFSPVPYYSVCHNSKKFTCTLNLCNFFSKSENFHTHA